MPGTYEKLTLRILIIIGLISIANFYYWFTQPEMIQNKLLFWLLIVPMGYDTLRVVYIWYHYWDISAPQKPVSSKKFEVDVLTTYFPGEPYEMVKETLLAIQRMKYPHTSWLCDEANDPVLKEFCSQHGIVHITRNNRKDAKAGNINNALKQATGDICLILDPDHVPKDNFLDEVIPYFENEQIGFVQSVQGYSNIKESQVAQGAAEQTFHFYGPVMMTMNSYGTVNAIGANCIFRRKALDSIGGHAAGLSEDLHTAMQLHAKGWKSIYVPETFTKGLVPSTLTAYYKQQLKWSRGTLDLLFNTYFKLFKHFTWRQKIHYGLLPLHFMSGFFMLISFLIPVISLFTATIPWKGNIINFGFVVLPIFITGLGIRFYVQQWLPNKSERGLHVLGGILLACTWWIHLAGLVYTLMQKKVPYLPTPKDNKDRTNFSLLIPNLTLIVISLSAVIYGLSIDFTPFSLLMSGFAIINVFLMLYTLYFANEKHKSLNIIKNIKGILNKLSSIIENIFYRIWYPAALPLIFFILSLLFGTYYQADSYGYWDGAPEMQTKNRLNPKDHNRTTGLKVVEKIAKETRGDADIIPLYFTWERDADLNFQQTFIDSVYMQQSIPVITWDPIINLHTGETKGKHVYELIVEGYFDSYIIQFANKLKDLEHPVYLRFAREFDNQLHPWYYQGPNASVTFKKAWIRTCEIFRNNGAFNVIWIWNPLESRNIASFFPGKDYIDWIEVNILSSGKFINKTEMQDFKSFYQPFHGEFKKLPLVPVMISEFGTFKNNSYPAKWIEDALHSMENEFREIKSLNSIHLHFDDALQKNYTIKTKINRTIPEMEYLSHYSSGNFYPQNHYANLSYVSSGEILPTHNKIKLEKAKGVNIKSGNEWRNDYHVLSRKKLLTDLDKMKNIGINTINFEGNTIYEYNLLNISKAFNMGILYGFWIPEEIDFMSDDLKVEMLKNNILNKVAIRKANDNILAWHIQNDVLYNQKKFYYKPLELYQKNAYIQWLKELIYEIKKIDARRPVVVDIEVNPHSVSYARMLLANIPDIDYLGLVVRNKEQLPPVIKDLNNAGIEYIFSEIDADLAVDHDILASGTSFFVTSWQDQHKNNSITFDGLIDRKSRPRTAYYQLKNALTNTGKDVYFPDFRILRPSSLILEGRDYRYTAMVYDEKEGWKYGWQTSGLSFEWSLVKCDAYGNTVAIKDVGHNSFIDLTIPEQYENFRLLLTIGNGKSIETTLSLLNTPLEDAVEN